MGAQGDTVLFKCPACKRQIRAPGYLAGRQFRCPNRACGLMVTVPISKQTPGEDLHGVKRLFGSPSLKKHLKVRPHILVLAAGALLLALVCVVPWAEYGETRKLASLDKDPKTGLPEWTYVLNRYDKGFVPIWTVKPNKKTRWVETLLLGAAAAGLCGVAFHFVRPKEPSADKARA